MNSIVKSTRSIFNLSHRSALIKLEPNFYFSSTSTVDSNSNSNSNSSNSSNNSSNDSIGVDFENTEIAFKYKTDLELVANITLYNFLSAQMLVKTGLSLAKFIPTPLLAPPIRATVFPHFTGGESMDELGPILSKNYSQTGLRGILNYSVEDDEGTANALDNNKDYLKKTLEMAADRIEAPFSCLKPTAICPPHIFERVTEILEYKRIYDPQFPLDSLGPILSNTPTRPSTSKDETFLISSYNPSWGPPKPLDEIESQTLSQALDRFDECCAFAVELCAKNPGANNMVMIDAERYHQQPAIDHIFRWLSPKYNLPGERLMVYNTYQLYTRDGCARMQDDINVCLELGSNFAAKIVRGAYMDEERERAALNQVEDPIHSTFEATSASYQKGIDILLSNPHQFGAVIASHNKDSITYALQAMTAAGISRSHPYFFFAQLYGMCDYISNSLASAGWNALKYIPFGPVEKVLPYLIRRLEENMSLLGGAQYEKDLMKKELRRRRSDRSSCSI